MSHRATCSAPSTVPTRRRLGLCACALLHYCSPSAATHEATLKASHSPTGVSRESALLFPPTQPYSMPPHLILLSSGLQDTVEDSASPKDSAETPAGDPDGANVSCSPKPGAAQASIGGEADLQGGS